LLAADEAALAGSDAFQKFKADKKASNDLAAKLGVSTKGLKGGKTGNAEVDAARAEVAKQKEALSKGEDSVAFNKFEADRNALKIKPVKVSGVDDK
jgi:predicted  nucleic acid-binding Zn-ribbon protein